MRSSLPDWCTEVHVQLKEKHISVNELAKMVGMSRPYVSNIINANVRSKGGVEKISGVLDIIPQDFNIV